MVERRRNSPLKICCLAHHFFARTQSAPHFLQRARSVFTPTPQPIQGIVPPPFANLALWTLQYFPMQLLPQKCVFPNNNHSQLFGPLMLTIGYIDYKSIYSNEYIYLLQRMRQNQPLVLKNNYSEPNPAPTNRIAACRKKEICVHAGLPQSCV